jgi:NAD(P)-dependent dehydrogenase (short-subunit alcohol dehydrogenase family)
MTVEEATSKFPQEVGIARYGEPEEIAEPMAFLVSPPGTPLASPCRPSEFGIDARADCLQ